MLGYIRRLFLKVLILKLGLSTLPMQTLHEPASRVVEIIGVHYQAWASKHVG